MGSSLAEASQPETQGVGPYSSADYRNGSDIESDNAYYDRVTQQALRGAGPRLSDSATDAEVMAYRMREAGFDGDMTPTGARLQLSPGSTDDPRVLELQSRIARLSAISNEARALGASMDSAITDRLNRESVIRETVSPLDGEVSGPGLRVSESLASRFADGVLGAVKGVTVEPLLQVHDLGLALGSAAYNELFRSEGDALWLPEMRSGMADAYANGASQTRLLLQATPLTAPGVASYDLTTAAMNGDWGGVAEGAGSLAGGLTIGKGVSKYGGYGLTFDDIGATGPMSSQMGAVSPRLIAPDGATEALASGKYARRTDVSYRLASEVNASYPEGYSPPYKPGTRVTEFTTTVDDVYVRVHGEDNMARSWMMKREAVEGLSPEQIQSKYALPEVPTHMSDVYVPAETRIRTGIVNPIFDGAGNAIQYELLQRLPTSAFRNTVKLGQ